MGKAVDWRALLASPQFRRLFSDGSKKNYENYYPKGKKELPKGDGSNKSESKRAANNSIAAPDQRYSRKPVAGNEILNSWV